MFSPSAFFLGIKLLVITNKLDGFVENGHIYVSSGITLTPSFVKIEQLVPTMFRWDMRSSTENRDTVLAEWVSDLSPENKDD
jgi:hypothetical protein